MRRKLKKYIIIYYMCVICGYEIAGTWVRNGMVLGTKWYEFWVRNGMPGVGISPRTCITSILQYMRCVIWFKGHFMV